MEKMGTYPLVIAVLFRKLTSATYSGAHLHVIHLLSDLPSPLLSLSSVPLTGDLLQSASAPSGLNSLGELHKRNI